MTTNQQMKNEVYCKLCRILTDYEDDNLDHLAEDVLYGMLTEVQINWEYITGTD